VIRLGLRNPRKKESKAWLSSPSSSPGEREGEERERRRGGEGEVRERSARVFQSVCQIIFLWCSKDCTRSFRYRIRRDSG